MSKGRRKTLPTGMPRTLAARVEFVAELLEGPRDAHGERTAPMITPEQAMEMLAIPLHEPPVVGHPDCVVKPACNACWYCLRRKTK